MALCFILIIVVPGWIHLDQQLLNGKFELLDLTLQLTALIGSHRA